MLQWGRGVTYAVACPEVVCKVLPLHRGSPILSKQTDVSFPSVASSQMTKDKHLFSYELLGLPLLRIIYYSTSVIFLPHQSPISGQFADNLFFMDATPLGSQTSV